VICGREIGHSQVYNLNQHVCEPQIFGGECAANARKLGWRLDGREDGMGTDYVVEPIEGQRIIRAVTKKARTVFEWGAGYSTNEYPKDVETLERWLTVEDSWFWTVAVQERGLPPKTSVLHLTGEDYFAAPAWNKWDAILIDGHFRNRCLHQESMFWLAEGGVILCQDAEEGGERHFGGPHYDFRDCKQLAVYRYGHQGRLKEYMLVAREPWETLRCWPEIENMPGMEFLL